MDNFGNATQVGMIAAPNLSKNFASVNNHLGL
jgi:hypothetical protein